MLFEVVFGIIGGFDWTGGGSKFQGEFRSAALTCGWGSTKGPSCHQSADMS